ncbi:hypothetical protein V1291_002684 [Nitrobacteraceae bacterium AZCC 1564]
MTDTPSDHRPSVSEDQSNSGLKRVELTLEALLFDSCYATAFTAWNSPLD